MPTKRSIIVMDLDHGRLSAVRGVVGPGSVTIKSWISIERPADLDAADPAAVGRWVGATLKEARFGAGRTVFTVPRADVVLKILSLPGRDISERELAEMVRLQMLRQMTVSVDQAAIDYLPAPRPDLGPEAGGDAEGGSHSVVVGAMPGDRVAWRRAVAKAAGLRFGGVELRSTGGAALLSGVREQMHADDAGPILGISIGAVATEFLLVEAGRLVFARAVDVRRPSPDASPDEVDKFVGRLAVEAKRTAMSYRVSQRAGEIASFAVVGDDALAHSVCERCEDVLDLPGESLAMPQGIAGVEEIPPDSRPALTPLVGLLARRALGIEGMDFANPRRAPDVGARTRQLVLAGAFVLFGLAGTGYVLAQLALDDLDADLGRLGDQRSSLMQEYAAYLLADARTQHLARWTDATVDWTAHLLWLSESLPSPELAQLSDLSGSMAAEVGFERGRGGAGYPGTWSNSLAASFRLTGRVDQRAVALGLREHLVDSDVYRVSSRGPDVAGRFDLQLETSVRSPPAPAREEGGGS